jgi:hypothetical protein
LCASCSPRSLSADYVAKDLCLRAAFATSKLTVREMWVRQYAVGGNADMDEVKAILSGRLQPDGFQHDTIAYALNEYFEDEDLVVSVAYHDQQYD